MLFHTKQSPCHYHPFPSLRGPSLETFSCEVSHFKLHTKQSHEAISVPLSPPTPVIARSPIPSLRGLFLLSPLPSLRGPSLETFSCEVSHFKLHTKQSHEAISVPLSPPTPVLARSPIPSLRGPFSETPPEAISVSLQPTPVLARFLLRNSPQSNLRATTPFHKGC